MEGICVVGAVVMGNFVGAEGDGYGDGHFVGETEGKVEGTDVVGPVEKGKFVGDTGEGRAVGRTEG